MAHGRSTLLATIVAFLLVAAPAAGEALQLSWRVADRLDLSAPAGGARGPGDIKVARWYLELRVAPAHCRPGAAYAIRIDRHTENATAPQDCVFRRLVPVSRPGTAYAVTVTDAEQRTADAKIPVRDRLVVSIGDSVASGEGNPDPHGSATRIAGWTDRRCHRSLRSGHARAALMVERGDATQSLTFVGLACSGATVPAGLLGSGEGPDPGGNPPALDAQVAEVARMQRHRGVDAVLLSIGGNDLDFASVVKFCASVEGCPDRRFRPADPLAESPFAETPKARDVIAGNLREMGRRFDDLAVALDRTGVAPEDVIVVEYFDPTHGADGRYCDRVLGVWPFHEGISAAEAEWAHQAVLQPLNREIAAAALRHGWRLVSGVDERFLRHGYCAEDQRWVRTVSESLEYHGIGVPPLRAGVSGTMHPNERGHQAIGELIAPALASVLASSEPRGGGASGGGTSGGGPDPAGPEPDAPEPTPEPSAEPASVDITREHIDDVVWPWVLVPIGVLVIWRLAWRAQVAWRRRFWPWLTRKAERKARWRRTMRAGGWLTRHAPTVPAGPSLVDAGRVLLALLLLVLVAAQLIVKDEVDVIVTGLLGGLVLLLMLPQLLEVTGFGVTLKLRSDLATTEEEVAVEGLGPEAGDGASHLGGELFALAQRRPRQAVAEGSARVRRRLMHIDAHHLGRRNPLGHPGVAADLEREGLLSENATHLVAVALATADALMARAEVKATDATAALDLLDRAYAALTPKLIHFKQVRATLQGLGYTVTEETVDARWLPDLVATRGGQTARVVPRSLTRAANATRLRTTAKRLDGLEGYAARAVVVPRGSWALKQIKEDAFADIQFLTTPALAKKDLAGMPSKG